MSLVDTSVHDISLVSYNKMHDMVQFSSVSSRSPHAHSTTVSKDGSAPLGAGTWPILSDFEGVSDSEFSTLWFSYFD